MKNERRLRKSECRLLNLSLRVYVQDLKRQADEADRKYYPQIAEYKRAIADMATKLGVKLLNWS